MLEEMLGGLSESGFTLTDEESESESNDDQQSGIDE